LTCLYDHQAKWAKWALIYVDESWSLQRELLSLLYDHSAEWIKWVLIYVFATHVNQSENRKKWSIYCVAQMCIYAKAESCLCNVYMCDVYELQHVCKDVAVVLCIWAKTVSCLCSVCDCNACFFIFYFFIKCMQSMTMTLSKRCMYVRLHVSWLKSLLYIFSLINHIDSLHKQALSIKQLLSFVLSFSRFFMFFSLYSFVFNSHFLVAIQVLFKYFSITILSILMINNINIMFMFLNCAFALSCNCSAL